MQQTQNSPYAVEMRDIVKMFGSFKANDGVRLNVRKGEIHAILGENGAGKSTLMNILFGLYQPTSGDIYVNGKHVRISSPNEAIALGIGMVHQHFMLIQPFTVTENIILGMENGKKLVLRKNRKGAFEEGGKPELSVTLPGYDIKQARRVVGEISAKYGLNVDPDAKIEDISVSMQQRVEILKVLYRGADILILDEPTSSLTPQEIIELVQIMRNLTNEGKTVILITHKLKEIKESADKCTIIRQGKYIDTVNVKDVTEQQLADMMVGRNVEFKVDKKQQSAGDIALSIDDLRAKDYRNIDILKGLSLDVRRGEIVGVAGIDGNGQTELVEILTGLKKATSGKITMNGTDAFNKSPKYLYDIGISSIPADRQKHGLVLDYSIENNLLLQNITDKPYSSFGTLRRRAIREHAKELINKFDIRPRGCETHPAGSLSGGNQQKVIIAREVTNDKDLLIAVNPTRGLDVGAIEYVHKYIVEQRNKGKAVLLVSFELDEIMSLSDRIVVIYGGRIVYSTSGEQADEKKLGLMMAGGGGENATK